MAKKKSKKPHFRVVPVGELVRQAEEQLQHGQPDEAMRTLLRAEAEVGRKPAQGAPASPHQAEWQPQIVRLLARAFFEYALATEDTSKKADALRGGQTRPSGGTIPAGVRGVPVDPWRCGTSLRTFRLSGIFRKTPQDIETVLRSRFCK